MVHHFFLPHPKTHKKAHLISVKALFVYVAFFVLMQIGFRGIGVVQPNILGITSEINQQDLIMLTNEQRQKYGLPALQENTALDKAAEEKAKNMFAENYWAHYSPSGKSPWQFISAEGYKYSYAGENLAMSFYTSKDVVGAWMASKKGHKENILDKNFTEIGMAVMEGDLQGQKTILVVQEFGKPIDYVADKPTTEPTGQKTAIDQGKPNQLVQIPVNVVPSQEVKSVTAQSPDGSSLLNSLRFDPYALTRTLGFSLIGFVAFLILVDFIIIKTRKKAFVNLYTRHAHNMAFLPIATLFIIQMHPGSVM